ncbi:MAG: RCC1 domain-containing protein [Mycoplasma sp.]
MKKTNVKFAQCLIISMISLFTLTSIVASLGLNPSNSLKDLGNNISKSKNKNTEAFNTLKGDNVKISLGSSNSAAIVNGQLFTWGSNTKTMLGIGSSDESLKMNKPVYVDVDGDKNPENDDVIEVKVGESFMAASTSSGFYAWGDNGLGQLGLGDGSERQYSTPKRVPFFDDNIPVKFSLSSNHAFASTPTGPYIWGSNQFGKLGLGNEISYNFPQKLTTLPGIVSDVAASSYFTAAVTTSGLYTWGYNNYGQLGLGNNTQFNTPQKVSITGTPSTISISSSHAASITTDGLYMWGNNGSAQLGLGDRDNRKTPVKVTKLVGSPLQTSVGSSFSFSVTSSGLYGWGNNQYGQLGLNNISDKWEPTKVTAISGSPSQLSIGSRHSSVVLNSQLYLWGNNTSRQLGVNSTNNDEWSPQRMDHASNKYMTIDPFDLTRYTDTEDLKNKVVGDITTTHLINLIKNNGTRLFNNYSPDAVITIKSIDHIEASYKDGNDLYGKIKFTFNNNKQTNWLGPQDINGVKFLPGNTDKQMTVSKFKKSKVKKLSLINEIDHQEQTHSVDELADELLLNDGDNPNRTTLEKFLEFDNFPTGMKVTKIENVRRNQTKGELLMDLIVDKCFEEGTTGEIVTPPTPTKYLNIKINNLRVPPPTIVDINRQKEPTITSARLLSIIKATEKNQVEFQKALSDYIDFSTYPTEAIFVLNIIKEDKNGYLSFSIMPSAWIDEKNVRHITSKTFIYVFDKLKPFSETTEEYQKYDKNISAQELIEDRLEITNGSTILANDIREHQISKYVNFTTFPLDVDLAFDKINFVPSTGEVSFDITIQKYINTLGDEVKAKKTLSYDFKVDIIPLASVEQYKNYSKKLNPQELTEFLNISENKEVSAESKELLKQYIDFKTFPKVFNLKTSYIRGSNINGTLEFGLICDSWFQPDKFLNKTDPKEFNYKLSLNKHSTSSISVKSKPVTTKGLQPDNFKNYLGSPSSPTHEERLKQFINFSTFPKDAKFSAIVSTEPDQTTGKVGLTVTASQHYDDRGYKQLTPKTFNERIITIPMVNETSKVVRREKKPKKLKSENFSDYILETKKDQTEKVVNFNNLNEVFKINEFFPDINNIPPLLKDQINKPTEFRIKNNEITVDGDFVKFTLEANQIWNNLGYFEIAENESNWFSFDIETELIPSPITAIIIGSTVGGTVLLLLILTGFWMRSKRR